MKMETVMEEGEEYSNLEDSEWTSDLDVSQLCRICANPNEYLIPIFHGEGLEHELKVKIKKHLPIKVTENDKLPTHLCYQCASTLIAWHDMVVGCLEADEKLKSIISKDDAEDCEMLEDATAGEDVAGLEDVKDDKSAVLSQIARKTAEADLKTLEMERKRTEDETERLIVEEEVTTEPAVIEEVATDSRWKEIEEDNNDEIYSQINGNEDIVSDVEDEYMSDFDSDEEFSTLYSCSICKASGMVIGEFLKHSRNHSKEEKQVVLERLVDRKLTSEMETRSAAAAYGFKVQPSMESSVTLYLCSVCGQGNLLLKNLKEHSKLHPHYLDSHFCNLCQKEFEDSGSLESHLEAHLDDNDLICQYCNRRFNVIEDLERHESSHQRTEYFCVVCRQTFGSKALILSHLKESHSTGTTCHICNQEFKTEAVMAKHSMNHAAVSVLKKLIHCFICALCGNKYDSRVSLQRHVLFLHNDRMPFVCEQCGFKVYREELLREHSAAEHNNDGHPAVCGKCDVTFTDKSALDKHMATHSKTDHVCKFCGIRFKTVQNLKYHLTSHGEVDFKNLGFDKDNSESTMTKNNGLFICDYCGEQFEEEDEFTNHLKHHSSSVRCDLCGKSFGDDAILNIHLNKVHTSKFIKPDVECRVFPFKCYKCDRSFRLEFELEEHNRSHGTFYQCHFCFEEFITDNELQDHIKTHSEDTFETVETTESTSSDEPILIEEILGS